VNFLFVGRIAPNKKIEDHIFFAEHYRRMYDAYYPVHLRRALRLPPTMQMIRGLITEFKMLKDAFIFTGPVPDENWPPTIAARRSTVDERARGFCAPLVEAMAADVPSSPTPRQPCRRRSAAPAWLRPRDLEQAAELAGALVFDERLPDRRHRRTAAAASGLRRAPGSSRDLTRMLDSLRSAPWIPDETSPLSSSATVPEVLTGSDITAVSSPAFRVAARRRGARPAARDYITWKNEYPEGTDRIRGVTSPALYEPETTRHHGIQPLPDWIFQQSATRARRNGMVEAAGPVVSGDQLPRANHQRYDVLIFFTYLYATTVMGVEIKPGRSVLVPTAHEEPAIRLEIYKDVFSKPAAIMFNTDIERQFLKAQFGQLPPLEETVGVGVDLPQHQPYPRMPALVEQDSAHDEGAAVEDDTPAEEDPSVGALAREFSSHLTARGAVFRRRHRLCGPFALYGGRIDPGKGCEELIEISAATCSAAATRWVLMGVKLMALPEEPFINFAGCWDRERLQALEAATVVVCPSPSRKPVLLALEALSVGTHILVNGRSPVLVRALRA
jgi:glycosyltransferase involved in cell wall biosynthesis